MRKVGDVGGVEMVLGTYEYVDDLDLALCSTGRVAAEEGWVACGLSSGESEEERQ